jgi:hypothetical protein
MKSTFGGSPYVKVALIPILAGTLYLVWPKPAAKESVATATKSASDAGREKRTKRPSKPNTPVREPITWPKIRLEELSGANPFDRRQVFPEPAVEAVSASPIEGQKLVSLNSPLLGETAPLESIEIQAIYESPQGVVAIIGDRMIHVGDRLEDGREVLSIHSDHILVSLQAID